MLRLSSPRYWAFGLTIFISVSLLIGFSVRRHDPINASGSVVSKSFLPTVFRTVPTPGPAPYPTPPLVNLGGRSRLGVWMGNGDDSTVDSLKQTGASWTRIYLNWSSVEPVDTNPPTYNFGRTDNLLAAIGRAGITPIVVIQGNPAWAASTSCGPVDKNPERLSALLSALVNRYEDSPYYVKYWEFYNEPENRVPVPWGNYLGGCFGDVPGKYVEMLQSAGSTAKAVDPNAKIVYGGLAMGQFSDPNTGQPIFNTDFFAQTLALGAGAYFDIANMHYFSSQSSTYAAYGRDVAGKVGMTRQIMSNYNVSKPLIITELSYTENAFSPDIQELQASYLPKALARGLSVNVHAMTWFLLKDWDVVAPNHQDYPYGLMDLNLNHRLSFGAYQTAVAEFGSADTVRPLIPDDVGGTMGVEGFVFTVNGQERWVLWAEDGQKPFRLPQRAFEGRDKFGNAITLPTTVSNSPVYVHLNPYR